MRGVQKRKVTEQEGSGDERKDEGAGRKKTEEESRGSQEEICEELNIRSCEMYSRRWQKTDSWNKNHAVQRGLSRSLHLSVCLSPLLSLCSPELHIHTQAPFSVVFASGCVLPGNQSSTKDEMHRWQAVIKHYVCVFLNTAKPQQPDLDSFHLVQLEQRGAISHIGESKWQREGAVKSFDNLKCPEDMEFDLSKLCNPPTLYVSFYAPAECEGGERVQICWGVKPLLSFALLFQWVEKPA